VCQVHAASSPAPKQAHQLIPIEKPHAPDNTCQWHIAQVGSIVF
jgi:hypothetical protein